MDLQDDNGLLAQAAALAGAMVAIVRHSGRRGTHQEFTALVEALEAVMLEYPNNPYVQNLLTAATREQIAGFARRYDEVPKQSEVQDFKMSALNRCAQAATWLAQHVTPQQAAEVKASILLACRRVAEESREGGFMSFGSTVDEAEQHVMDEITRALQAD